jgi:hypothetical protein
MWRALAILLAVVGTARAECPGRALEQALEERWFDAAHGVISFCEVTTNSDTGKELYRHCWRLELASGKCSRDTEHHAPAVKHAMANDDGSLSLRAAGEDKWAVRTKDGKKLSTIERHEAWFVDRETVVGWSMQCAADPCYVAKLYNARTGAELQEIGAGEMVPLGNHLWAMLDVKKIVVRDMRTGAEVRTIPAEGADDLEFNLGSIFLSGKGELVALGRDGHVWITDPEKTRIVRHLDP